MTLRFEALSTKNYHTALSIQQQSHPRPWSEAVFVDCFTPPYFSFQLYEDAHVVGYCVGMAVVGEATLMDIGVQASSQGQGYGKAILGEFIQQAKKLACTEAWLEVRESNVRAISLYEMTGFEVIEKRLGYYANNECANKKGREDGLIMRAFLNNDV